MVTIFKRVVLLTILLGLGFTVFAQGIPGNGIPRKIVVFQEYFPNQAAQAALIKNSGAAVAKHLGLINAVAVSLPPQAEKALLNRAEVLRIDDDLVITATGKGGSLGKPKPQPSEVLPWGVDRVEAEQVWNTTKGLAIKVAIVDTGIDLDHADLINNIKGNVNMINPLKSGNDDNGHGTHVAGIIAAVDNTIGVVGVGPEVYLYAVKVLNSAGTGTLSDLIEALDWCINNKMQIINMSLGAPTDNQSFHDAIIKTYQAGITQIVAAGNNGATTGAVDYPAKYPETVAVSAVGQNPDGSLYFAGFSSYGPEIDLAAPGVNIYSTYNDGYYKPLNGTSMATPHVTGVAALVLQVKGAMSPEQLKTELKNNCEDLGLSSYQQGAGLVRADLAIR